jgi:SAM-dependent methyltransferase
MDLTADTEKPYAQIIRDYETLEPGESDTWNPLHGDFELLYRLRLIYSAKRALSAAGINPGKIRVLDLGCGNGRSTRMYLDFGLLPEQLRGVDLRPGAVSAAKRRNPGIDYMAYDGIQIPPPSVSASYDWVQLATVVSSIKDTRDRKYLVERIDKVLRPGGYLFYFDLVVANPFAGRDWINPRRNLFDRYSVVWRQRFYSWSLLPLRDRLRTFSAVARDAQSALGMVIFIPRLFRVLASVLARPIHEALLLKKSET